MRPTISSTCALPSSSVIFSFLTSRETWPSVTLRASVRPASTSSCLMSLRTTGMPEAAMVWAIWPPMVPAPTTAALKTNMAWTLARRALCRLGGELALGLEPAAEAHERVAQRGAPRTAPEQHGDEGPAERRALELVLKLDGDLGARGLGLRGERHRLDAAQLRVLDLDGLAHARLVVAHPLDDAAAAVAHAVPHDARVLAGPLLVPLDD